MKKKVLAISVSVLLFSACSKNSHAPSLMSAAILGKWDFVSETWWDKAGNTYTDKASPGEYMQCNANGTVDVCWWLVGNKHMLFNEPYSLVGTKFNEPDFSDNSTVAVSDYSLIITSADTSASGGGGFRWTYKR